MKKILKLPAHKIILWFCFLPALIYTMSYELILTRYPSQTETIYKIGIITSKVFYSILASSIFYFVSQYIPIFLPRVQKKKKILNNVRIKHEVLEGLLIQHGKYLGLNRSDWQSEEILVKKLNEFNLNATIEKFKSFEEYYINFRKEALELIQSMLFYHDYLSLDYLKELQSLEKDLLFPKIFNYDNYHLNGDIYFYTPMAAPITKRLFSTMAELRKIYKTEFSK